MSKVNNNAEIERMKMSISHHLEQYGAKEFNDLRLSLVNPENKSGFFFVTALNELEASATVVCKEGGLYQLAKSVEK